MPFLKPGDVVPRSGFYQCIYCKNVVLVAKGNALPQCPGKCPEPAYTRTDKTIPPIPVTQGR
jgi:hypothetical protein